MKDANFSLSEYFNQIKRPQKKVKMFRQEASAETLSTVDRIAVLKALKAAADQKLPLTALAKAANMKLGSCEELVEELADEELLEVAEDDDTGNPIVSLTLKGSAAL